MSEIRIAAVAILLSLASPALPQVLIRANVIATSGRAVEAAGDVDVLLLDKTGTITLGNRQASAFLHASGVKSEELADAAQLASLADETPEGRSIVVLAKQKFGLRERVLHRSPWLFRRTRRKQVKHRFPALAFHFPILSAEHVPFHPECVNRFGAESGREQKQGETDSHGLSSYTRRARPRDAPAAPP